MRTISEFSTIPEFVWGIIAILILFFINRLFFLCKRIRLYLLKNEVGRIQEEAEMLNTYWTEERLSTYEEKRINNPNY